ncbi:MAG TPA: VCBS repeat-containing protein, partial [Panacibacter sp.]|nr:VCBS repeat-containing protein [Panacibacter sp.]
MCSSIFNHENEVFTGRRNSNNNLRPVKWMQPLLKLSIVLSFVLLVGSTGFAQCNNFRLHSTDNPLKGFRVTSGIESHPFFVDIDGDGDLDCFSGEYTTTANPDSRICFFRNEGTANAPLFKKISGSENPFDNLSLPVLSIPNFIDIDADGDFDCFIGDGNTGALRYYKNEGTSKNPVFEKQSAALNPLSMVKFSAASFAEPAFADIDGDGDFDCLVADLDGNAHYFKNTGTAKEPFFEHLKGMASPFSFLKNYEAFGPSFYDWNNDGLVDLFLGNRYY